MSSSPPVPASPPARRRRLLLRAIAAGVVWIAAACSDVPPPPPGCANCPVCVENADLACVCVKIGDETPSVEWDGRTWYFCSEECKAAFLANPKHYLPAGEVR